MAGGTTIKFGAICIVRIRYGVCDDARPCVVVSTPRMGKLEVLPLSSQMDLFQPGPHFRIDNSHPDFPATRLKRTCYANSDEKHEVDETDLRKPIGRLENELLRQFENWYG